MAGKACLIHGMTALPPELESHWVGAHFEAIARSTVGSSVGVLITRGSIGPEVEETGSSALLSRVVQGLQSANLLLGEQVGVASARCLGGLPLSGLGLDHA